MEIFITVAILCVILVVMVLFTRWIIGTNQIIELLKNQNDYLHDIAEVLTRPNREIKGKN